MWLNPQTWSVISGFANEEQAKLALDNVYNLLNTEYGAMVMYPPYKEHAFDGALMLLFNACTKEMLESFLNLKAGLFQLKLYQVMVTGLTNIIRSVILLK